MDESGQSTDRYMCVGGIVINQDRVDEVRKGFERIRIAADINSEIKWTNLRAHRLRAYKSFIFYFFELLESNQVHFHVLICDFHKFERRSKEQRVQSVSKMLYQLSLHRFCKRYGKAANLHLFPDSGEYSEDFMKYRHHLNNECRTYLPEHRKSAETPAAHIEPRQSHLEPLLQLNDLILGAIAYRRNERYDDPNASKHKKSLARLVSKKADSLTFSYDPRKFPNRFTVWNFKRVK